MIDVSAGATEIARGVSGTLSALIGGYASQDDNATVSAQPLDAAGAAIAPPTVLAAGPLGRARGHLRPAAARRRRWRSRSTPAAILVTITATRTSGQYNDGYVDNVSFSFGGPPVAGKSVGARPVSGTVLVKCRRQVRPARGGAAQERRRGRRPQGPGRDHPRRRRQGACSTTASSSSRQSGGITTLTLSEALDCSKRALTAAKKPKTRKLWGDGKGKFRTKGKYSAATVRGTKWLVSDTCTSTRTTVRQGSVSVRDDVAKKTVVVRAGKSYTARARR